MATRAPTNKLEARFCQQLSNALRLHRVVLVFDPDEQLQPLFTELSSSDPTEESPGEIDLLELQAQWFIAGSSLFALRHQLETLVSSDYPDPLLIVVPKRNEEDCRATLLELIRAGTVFDAQLINRARPYLREVLEPDKVTQLLQRPGLTYRDIAIALEQSGNGAFSQLKGLFQTTLSATGSPPEVAEMARLWLASDQFDAAIGAKNLDGELQELLHSRWGLGLPTEASLDEWRQRAQRALLLHEFLGDWHGDELTAFAKQQLPVGKTESANALADVRALRQNAANAYIEIANQVQTDLNLHELIASERPGVLGAIDTFPCEEQFLLRSVDQYLSQGQWQEAQALVSERQDSFWLVGQPTDPRQSERRLQWELGAMAGKLGVALDHAEEQLPKPSAPIDHWLDYQADQAHLVDRWQRRLEEQAATLTPDEIEISQGLELLRNRYEALLEKQTQRFTDALQQAGWLLPKALPQTKIWNQRVQAGAGRPVVFWVDALRYEMGAALHERFNGWSADQLADLKLELGQAALPSITPVGMAALLPGAEKSFQVADRNNEACSVVDGVAVGWSDDKAKRIAHLKQRVPSVVVLNLGQVISSTSSQLATWLEGNGPVVITSIGIDEAGERDRDELFANVRADMQRELELIEEAVRRLSELNLETPCERFVITADHGYIHLPLGREEAMRIPAPDGKKRKLERRCWIGHPSAVKDPCVEIPPTALGYGTDGLSVVVPRSAGVFKAGGSLCYHHGGTSIQELLIPVLSFRCAPQTPKPETSSGTGKAKRNKKQAWPGELPDKITNRILMLPIEIPVDLMNHGQQKQVVLAAYDSKSNKLLATPIQAIGAELDRETNRLTLTPGQQATIGVMLPSDVSAKKLYLELRDAATDIVLHKSPDLPVDLIA